MSERVYRSAPAAPRGGWAWRALVLGACLPACAVEQDPGPIRRGFLEARAEAAARYQRDLEQELEATRVRIARLERDLEDAVLRENALIAELSQVLDALTTLETNLLETRQRLELAESEKRVAEERLDQVNRELEEFRKTAAEARGKLDEARANQGGESTGSEGAKKEGGGEGRD